MAAAEVLKTFGVTTVWVRVPLAPFLNERLAGAHSICTCISLAEGHSKAAVAATG